MIAKEIIGILLLFVSLQVLANDNQGETSDMRFSSNQDFPSTEINNFQNHKKGFRESYHFSNFKFQNDYKEWENKKHDSKEIREKSNHLRFNEIQSKEYDEKYKKHEDSDKIYNGKEKSFHNKRALEKKEERKETSLLHDVDVNFINNTKEISGDSEMITNKVKFANKERYQENYQNGNELYMKRFKKDFYQNLLKIDLTNPPPPNDTVLMARYIVHNVDWAALGTLSGRSPTKGSPFVCVKATSDGLKNGSSGIPFFYMSSMDLCTQDLEKDNRVSVLMTLSQTDFCKEQNLDPQDPRCAKLTLSGKIKKIKSGSDEEKFAKTALFSRHPAMATWPADHQFYFTKLKIGQIVLLDQFGGATYIKVKDYLNGKVVEPELKRK